MVASLRIDPELSRTPASPPSFLGREMQAVANPVLLFTLSKELYGTFVFLFVSYGGVMAANMANGQSARLLIVSSGFGVGITTALLITRGGFYNPALVVAAVITRRLDALVGLLYIVVQILASMLAASLVYAVTPSDFRGQVAANTPGYLVSNGQAFSLELIGTMILASVVWSTVFHHAVGPTIVPFCVGAAIFVLHVLLVFSSGAGINPARSFGSAVVSGIWSRHWIYWVAPVIGAVFGASAVEAWYVGDDSSPAL